MKFKSLLTFSLIALSAIGISAKSVDKTTAEKVARNYYFQQAHYFDTPISIDAINFSDSYVKSIDDIPVMYVFDIEGGGFVLVSADDAMYPVLGYCYEEGAKFDIESQGHNYKSFISSMMYGIKDLITSKAKQEPAVAEEWKTYSTDNATELITAKDDVEVGPLITAVWNQDYPYNYYAPLCSAGGSGGRCYAGCVATAMAVQMFYWGYPYVGEGSSSYYCSGYGMQSAYYNEAYYDWKAMPTSITKNDETDAVLNIALIQYHCGVSVRMQFDPNGSGAYSGDVPAALHDHFKYPYATYVQKSNTSTWETMLMGQLDSGYPLYYSGHSPTEGGHAFNCDGYRVVGNNKTFHFNFNWSGYKNSWYTSSSPDGFSQDQAVVKDFYPDPTDYPTYFENVEVTSKVGRIDDGSGPVEDYLPGTYNTWLINPQSEYDTIKTITLSWESFDIAEGDVVNVYDGSDTNAELLASYTGGDTPGSVTSTGNKMFVEFYGNNAAPGFVFTYTTSRQKYCNTSTPISSIYGTIVSNPDDKHYNPKTLCRWNCTYPESTDGGYIKFNYLNTYDENDFVSITDFDTEETYIFYGNTTPDELINYGNKGFQLVFRTDGFIEEGNGFSVYFADWSYDGMREFGLDDIRIYPNPATDKLYITMPNIEAQEIKYQIANSNGMIVAEDTMCSSDITSSINISSFPAGVYVVRFTSNTGVATKKFVVE